MNTEQVGKGFLAEVAGFSVGSEVPSSRPNRYGTLMSKKPKRSKLSPTN
jgi:hypothetical protein